MYGSVAYGLVSGGYGANPDAHPYGCSFMPQDLIFSGVNAWVLTQ